MTSTEGAGCGLSPPEGNPAGGEGRSNGFSCRMGRLYREHKAHLRRLLSHRLANDGEAEDVIHEAFVHFLAAYGSAAAVTNPLAMLFRIASNIIRDGHRAECLHRERIAEMAEPLAMAPPAPDPEVQAASRQRLQRLATAIDNLPPRCREVFLLHKIDGMSHSRVATLLGISQAAVEKHIMRAYGRLREDMADDLTGEYSGPMP